MKPIPFNAFAKLLKLHHLSQTLIRGVAIDSRKIHPGDLFFALPGNRVDGHAFLKEVAQKKACGAVVREDYRGENFGIPLLAVPDVLAALQEFARISLARRKTKVVAITGSLGKTTTKEFARTLLSTHFRVFANPLSYNSQVTLPLTILMADETEDYLILEMGMTHEGNIKNLISIAPPDVALLTTVAVQHASNFSDGVAGIAREKAQVFSHPKTRLGLLHYDIPHFKEVSSTGSCPKKTFSIVSKEADYFLKKIPEGVRIHSKGEPSFDMALDLPMPVHDHNFLAALSLARNLGVSWEAIRDVAPSLKLPAMRFEKVEKQGITFINDAYNANPDAIKAALENLPKPQSGGKVIAVLSEMDALGSYSEAGHTLVAETALRYADYLLCVGSRCETMHKIWQNKKKPALLFEKRSDLEEKLKQLVSPGDVVLLKGARAYALDQILNAF